MLTTTTGQRCLIWYTGSAKYCATYARPGTEDDVRRLGLRPDCADGLMILLDADARWYDYRDVRTSGFDKGLKSLGFVLGAHTIVYPLAADLERRIQQAEAQRKEREAEAEQREREQVSRRPAPRLGGDANGPCPRCGTWCCGDCVASEVES